MKCPQCSQGSLVIPPDEHPSYLICSECAAIQLTYKPQDYQEEFHRTPYRINEKDGTNRLQIIGVFGGYGSAKSTASLHEFFLRALECPNSIGLVTAPTLPLLKKTTWKTLLDEIIPPPLIADTNKQEMTITLTNGYVIYGIPSDDEEKLRSINAGHCHMEEASGIKRSIYIQLISRMRHQRAHNRAIFVCSNPDLGWIKDDIVDNEPRANPIHPRHKDYNPDITCYIWPTRFNKYLPLDFIDNLTRNKPEWWVKRFTEGSFEHADGMVYPNASKCFIEDDPKILERMKREGWEIVIGADFGRRNPTADLFGAIDPIEGMVYIYKEYYVAGKIVPEHAAALGPMLDEIPHGLLRFMKGDPTGKNKNTADGKSVFGLYNEYGIYYQEGNNDVIAGLLKVNSYIERGKLKIFKSCENTQKEMLTYKYPELSMDDEKDPDEKPMKVNDHAMDALRYMIMGLPDDPDLLKTHGTKQARPEDYDRLYEEQMYETYREYEKLTFMDVGY